MTKLYQILCPCCGRWFASPSLDILRRVLKIHLKFQRVLRTAA